MFSNFRTYYENLIPVSPTDHMELREGSNEDDEDFEECVDEVEELIPTLEEDQLVPHSKDLVIEEVEDLEEIQEAPDSPHSKHIKKSNSTEETFTGPKTDNAAVPYRKPKEEGGDNRTKPSEDTHMRP